MQEGFPSGWLRFKMRRSRYIGTFLLLLCAANALAGDPPGSLLLRPVELPGVENGLQLTDRIYSGGEPHSEQAFKGLARLGVKTIVSVDGSTPDAETARRYGIRYVHVPIGYDAVGQKAQLALSRVAQEADGPIFLHCHHGQHRGPAAAAIVCVADGAVTADQAKTILEAAKTSRDYPGLWRDVDAYRRPSPETRLPALVEKAEVESFAAAMAKADRHFDQLKLCRESQWKAPTSHPDLVARQEALLVYQQLREAGRHLASQHDQQFRDWLAESEAAAQRLEASLKSTDDASAEKHFAALEASCKQCHAKHRDR